MAERTKTHTTKESLRLSLRAFRLISRYNPGFLPALGLNAAVSSVIPYAAAFFSARIIDELAFARRAEVLWQWVIAAVISGALLTLADKGLRARCDAKWETFYLATPRLIRDKMLSLDFSDMDRVDTHDKVAQIRENENWMGLGLPKLVSSFEKLAGSLAGIIAGAVLTIGLVMTRVPAGSAMAFLDHPLAWLLLVLALAVPSMIAPMLIGKAQACYQSASEDATFSNRLFNAFGFMGNEAGRALDMRIYNQQTLARHYMQLNRTHLSHNAFARVIRWPVSPMQATATSLSAVLTGVVYVYVCLKALAGAFGVGMVTQYVVAVTTLTGNIKELLSLLANIRNNAPFLQKIFEFLDIPNAMYQGSLTTEKRADRQYDVEFKDVSFQYPGSDNWALRHVSVKFKVGSRLAVVGENGSGKTTFIKLLCRLYDPQEGQILLNGIDIRKYNYRDYMNVFSVVFQDFQLLSQPLGANVAGSASYDRARVLQSLTDAGFGERLTSLPDGLDTQLYRDFDGEGMMISGGEAQKIAIARALYKDSPFIILDEPTAALDPMAEAEIYAQFNEISGDKTAIYISHRLSSCRFCDEILVFDNGLIVQQGSHDGLLGNEAGKYHQLWHAQAQYYDQ